MKQRKSYWKNMSQSTVFVSRVLILLLLSNFSDALILHQPRPYLFPHSFTNNVTFRVRCIDKRNGVRPLTEISLSIDSIASVVNNFWMTSPYTAAAAVCGVKASAADLVAQNRQYSLRGEEKEQTRKRDFLKRGLDFQRNIAFLLYGAVYQGMAQEFIYNHLYPVWFGTGTTMRIVLIKVSFDLFIQTTLITLPIAYLTKSLIYRYSFKEGIRRYFDDIKNHGLLTKYFVLWGPVQCLTFSVVPEHLRVTFIAFVSFFWLIILSTIASRTLTKPNEECLLADGQTCNIDG